MTIPAVIVDVDGTLAAFDPDHVGHWVLGEQKHWRPFFVYMANAPLIEPIARLVHWLQAQEQAILICSGRPDSYRKVTLDWLNQNRVPYHEVYLRPVGEDHVADETIKAALL